MKQPLYQLILLLFAGCFARPQGLNAQTNNFFYEHLSVTDGLSSNRISDMLQDKQGFYWIATSDGLNRFDGSSVKIFRNNRYDTASLAHNNCITLVEGANGDIWVATSKGVSRYQKKTGTFRNYFFRHGGVNDNLVNNIYGLAKDGAGNIWAASYGLWKINHLNDSIANFLYSSKPGSLSDASGIAGLTWDSNNKGLWLQTDSAINFFDPVPAKFFHYRHNPRQWPVFNNDNRRLYAAGKNRLWIYDQKTMMLSCYRNLTVCESSIPFRFPHAVSNFSVDEDDNPVFSFELLPAVLYHFREKATGSLIPDGADTVNGFRGIVNKVYRDTEGNQWLCSMDGLYIVKNEKNLLRAFSLNSNEAGFPNNIYSLVKNRSVLWLELRNGICSYDPGSRKIDPVKSLIGRNVMVLYRSGDSSIWLGERNKLLQMRLPSKEISLRATIGGNPYFMMAVDAGRFAIATWNDGLYIINNSGKVLQHFNTKNGLASNYLTTGMFNKIDESCWVGMNGGKGFAKVDLRSNKIKNFLLTSGKNSAVEFNTVTAILQGPTDQLWLGTYGGGIYHFNTKSGQFQNYQQGDGLSGNYINTLAYDKAGNLWISTAAGIDVMDTITKSIHRINKPMQQVNNDHIINLFVDGDTFYYSAANKILAIDTRQYSTSKKAAAILIAEFKAGDRQLPGTLDSAVSLSYDQNFFSVAFSVLKIHPGIPAQYKYFLRGFDKDWTYSGNRGFANYTNVPPGKYTLLLNATNETGQWNETPLEIAIVIKAPFWKTWWFYLLAFSSTAVALFLLFKTRLRQIKRRQQQQLRLIVATQEKEKKTIAAELHDDLGVRLSALKYFVASLKKYLSVNDEQAISTYEKTVSVIDESVEDVRYMLVNLSPKTLQDYGYLAAIEDLVNKLRQLRVIDVTLHQQGMEGRLQAEAENGLYRITQELINNTLKHANASCIRLDIERTSTAIVLMYADNGKAFDPQKPNRGYGLENIYTRVALLGGKIEWKTAAGKSTTVSIAIPYNHT